MKQVVRTASYAADHDAIEEFIAKENPAAGADLWLHIDDQVERLSDPLFYRRIGRVPGTMELVAHENYIVILEEDQKIVTVLNVVHAKRQWPAVV